MRRCSVSSWADTAVRTFHENLTAFALTMFFLGSITGRKVEQFRVWADKKLAETKARQNPQA
jgi:hypothetical protein